MHLAFTNENDYRDASHVLMQEILERRHILELNLTPIAPELFYIDIVVLPGFDIDALGLRKFVVEG